MQSVHQSENPLFLSAVTVRRANIEGKGQLGGLPVSIVHNDNDIRKIPHEGSASVRLPPKGFAAVNSETPSESQKSTRGGFWRTLFGCRGCVRNESSTKEILTRDISLAKDQIARLTRSNDVLSDEINKMSGLILNIKDELDEVKNIHEHVKSTFKIEGISQIREDARSGRIEFIDSPPFYISGYKMCTRLFLDNSDSIRMGICIMSDNNGDQYNTWPVSSMGIVNFLILDQTKQNPVCYVDSICLDESSESYKHNLGVVNPAGFEKPGDQETNPCAGIICSCVGWKELDQSPERYFANDSLKLKTVVRIKKAGPCFIQRNTPPEYMGFKQV